MFSVRLLNDFDYDLLCTWWKAWRWTAPPRDFLPQNGKGGYMVMKDDIPIVAGFIYFTNSSVCWSEFIISDFNYKDKESRKEAIKILIFELNEVARKKGFKYIYTVVKDSSLEKSYLEMGYVNGSKKVNEMFKILS